jgi:hypothetical protein
MNLNDSIHHHHHPQQHAHHSQPKSSLVDNNSSLRISSTADNNFKSTQYLGVFDFDPAEYVRKYGNNLVRASDLPAFVRNIKTPDGLVLAADYQLNSKLSPHELVGDVEALRLVDLDREGLSEYRPYLERLNLKPTGGGGSWSTSTTTTATVGNSNDFSASASQIAEDYFKSRNLNRNARISIRDAEQVAASLNNRFGKRHDDDSLGAFIFRLDANRLGSLGFEQFIQLIELIRNNN